MVIEGVNGRLSIDSNDLGEICIDVEDNGEPNYPHWRRVWLIPEQARILSEVLSGMLDKNQT